MHHRVCLYVAQFMKPLIPSVMDSKTKQDAKSTNHCCDAVGDIIAASPDLKGILWLQRAEKHLHMQVRVQRKARQHRPPSGEGGHYGPRLVRSEDRCGYRSCVLRLLLIMDPSRRQFGK